MKNLRIGFVFLLMWCCLQSELQAQRLFEREEPAFQASVIPTSNRGTVLLVFYFTHSRISAIETSIWLREQDAGFSGTGGDTRLIRGLQETRNRQQDTIVISGLKEGAFYTFGLDYRAGALVASKFNSVALKEAYRYTYQSEVNQPAEPTDAQTERSDVPCQNPDLLVQIATEGYCGAENKPAVLIQCVNCQGKEWTFSVELFNSNTNSGWRPLRADGEFQSAAGNAMRTEPLCTTSPGVYYARVIARGKNCATTITHNVGTPIAVLDRNVLTEKSPNTPTAYEIAPARISALPDTCIVRANARLVGNVMRGTVELAANSPCGAFRPYAEVQYVHPGYRDIVGNPIPLTVGSVTPFEFTLDNRDLSRSIHTIRVVSFISPEGGGQGIPMGAFWVRPGDAEILSAKGASTTNTPPTPTASVSDYNYASTNNTVTLPEDPMLSQDIQTISVSASDPNCNQVQDISLVYLSGQPEKPLYISWLNPRCCQEEGCRYSIWAGATPDKLRLLIEGSKKGSTIKEILNGIQANDTYIEIVIKTPNGNRKAAYVLGEGPKYGIEEILEYRDRLKPQVSDPIVVERDLTPKTPNMTLGGDLAARGVPAEFGTFSYEKPQHPISNFQPCKYEREVLIVGNLPAKTGDPIKIQYNFSEKGYRYTLYLQPENSTEWVIAPGTKELQTAPLFSFDATPWHAGKYMILVRKADSSWGCLATPLEKSIELRVLK